MTMFQQRHYVAIARTIANMPSFAPSLHVQRESVAEAFETMFANDNVRFNRDRFFAAARGEPNGRDR